MFLMFFVTFAQAIVKTKPTENHIRKIVRKTVRIIVRIGQLFLKTKFPEFGQLLS